MSPPQRQLYAISDLRDQPAFCATVADRIWRAWWQRAGHPLELVADHMQEMLNDNALPFGLVAHDGAQFLGSTLIISCDLAERPQYAPWVAAVWGEAEHRGRGIGRALVRRAADEAFDLGHESPTSARCRKSACSTKDSDGVFSKKMSARMDSRFLRVRDYFSATSHQQAPLSISLPLVLCGIADGLQHQYEVATATAIRRWREPVAAYQACT